MWTHTCSTQTDRERAQYGWWLELQREQEVIYLTDGRGGGNPNHFLTVMRSHASLKCFVRRFAWPGVVFFRSTHCMLNDRNVKGKLQPAMGLSYYILVLSRLHMQVTAVYRLRYGIWNRLYFLVQRMSGPNNLNSLYILKVEKHKFSLTVMLGVNRLIS